MYFFCHIIFSVPYTSTNFTQEPLSLSYTLSLPHQSEICRSKYLNNWSPRIWLRANNTISSLKSAYRNALWLTKATTSWRASALLVLLTLEQILTSIFTDWRRTARSIVLLKIFVCFLRTGGGQPGVLFYKRLLLLLFFFFKVYFWT